MRDSLRYLFPVLSCFFFCCLEADAREAKKGFDLKWDVGGDLLKFTHNSQEKNGGKVSWQPGGALNSLGSLKATGSNCSFERYDWFKSGAEKTLSFHYLMHGYTQFDVRLNLADKAQRKTFDNAAMYKEHKCKQDEWVFVQVKLSDISARNPKKRDRKITPDLIFKSITFVAEYNREHRHAYKQALPEAAERFILIDNLRIGPPIREADITVKKREKASYGTKTRMLLDFEDEAQVKLLTPLHEVVATPSDKYATSGKKSAKLVFKAGQDWPTIQLDKSLLGDWSGYDFLSLDFTTDDIEVLSITAEIWDPETKGFSTRCTYENVRNSLLPVHKGKTQVLVDLRKAIRNEKQAKSFAELRKDDLADPSQITKIKIWITTKKRKKDYITYLDNVRLMQEGAIESNMNIQLPKGALAYDFGENSPLVKGFTEVSLLDVYSDKQSYGFVNPEGIRAEGKDWPDPLTGDYVGGGHDDEGNWRDSKFEFRTKLPNGKYHVWLCAGFFPTQDVYVDLNVNGDLLYDGEMTGKAFYTKRWFYRFFDTHYSEKPNALWHNYVAKIFPGRVLETEVTNGEFYIKGNNSFISALVLTPASGKAEFEKMRSSIQSERIRFFYKDLYLNRLENKPCRITDKDFVLFVPGMLKSIKPWSGIDEKDTQEVKLHAARGEAIPFQVAIRPFRDLGKTALTITDLTATGGARIPAKNIQIFYKKYISEGRNVRDWGLMPRNSLEIEKDLCRAFWLRISIPEDAAPGEYSAKITAAAGPIKRELPVTLTVFPFKTETDIPISFGLYYDAPDGGQHTGYNRVKNFERERDRILEEQVRILRDYGMTSSGVPTPVVKELRGNGVLLDVAPMAKACSIMKANGMFQNKYQQAMPYILSIGRRIEFLLRQKGGRGKTEFDIEGFDMAYKSAVRKIVQWGQDEEVPLILWVVDEPREMPNPWNRNLRDTIKYLKIIKGIPGAVRMCTPMGDSSQGVSYLPLLDHLEVVATHPTPHSTRIINKAMANKEQRLWIYNAGRDRFSNGFYVWRVGATGKFEWHFSMWLHDKDRRGYMGSDIHNPFLNYEYNGTFVPAPLKHKGAVIPTEKLMTMSMGINDYRYIYTLEKLIRSHKAAGTKTKECTSAAALVNKIRSAIEVIPETKGYASSDDDELAKVGKGIVANNPLDQWRREVAGQIIMLKQ